MPAIPTSTYSTAEGALDGDRRAVAVGVVVSQVDREVTAHGAAHVDGLIQLKCVRNGIRVADVLVLAHRVLRRPPLHAVGRKRLAVVRKVESDDTEVLRDLLVAEKVVVLTAIGTGRVAHDERDSRPGTRHRRR
jgi:hypothetical protein